KKRYAGTPLPGNPDFVKLAEAYGAVGLRVTEAGDVADALREAIASPKVYLLDFVVEPEENVFPMVPAGEAINRMIGGMS
ncbi:MAG: acetolactate synthase large subunit, partial [Phycisphaerae bacterium]|nr:acetolactate synthase large subunit [Phycisphaerae bacterium]